MPHPARNQSCPCGSGLKYKKCHYPVDAGERTATPPRAPIHDLDNKLAPQILDFAQTRLGPRWVETFLPETDDEAAFVFWTTWALYHGRLEGRTAAEAFEVERGWSLTRSERAWLASQAVAWLSIWEVTDIDRSAGVTVTDLLTGESRWVHDVSASTILTKRDAVLGRVVDHEGVSVFCGVHPRSLPPLDAADLVRRARKRLRARQPVPLDRLREEDAGRYLIARWNEAVFDATTRALVPPRLQNTDGDDLVPTVDHFSFEPGLRSEILSTLASIARAEAVEAGDAELPGESVIVFSRPGNPVHREWDNTIVGRAVVMEEALRLETNSIQRADALRSRIEDAAGRHLRHERREELDPRMTPLTHGGPPPQGRAFSAREEKSILRQVLAQHYANWLDEPVPALQGRTPREAVRTLEGRQQVDALIKDMENYEARARRRSGFDFDGLRRELRLEAVAAGRGSTPTGAKARPPRQASGKRRVPTPAAGARVYRLKVTLRGARPPIWRRVEVGSRITLAELHQVLQVVMGWTDSHLHEFEAKGVRYGISDEMDRAMGVERVDERRTRLDEVMRRPQERLVYEYDFGDGWTHDVTLEAVTPPVAGTAYPVVTGGARACPPEDVGGVHGYARFLRVLANPADPEHDEMVDWAGGAFDPDAFDIEAVNRALGSGARRPPRSPSRTSGNSTRLRAASGKKTRPVKETVARKGAGARCGLCGKARKLTRTECCGQWICDDEDKYVLFSYARNSCFRNHRRYTLCGYHWAEKHPGDWRECQRCRADFPTELYVHHGTNEYNFVKLENPPSYEPTLCKECGAAIRLAEDAHTVQGKDYFCERCIPLPR